MRKAMATMTTKTPETRPRPDTALVKIIRRLLEMKPGEAIKVSEAFPNRHHRRLVKKFAIEDKRFEYESRGTRAGAYIHRIDAVPFGTATGDSKPAGDGRHRVEVKMTAPTFPTERDEVMARLLMIEPGEQISLMDVFGNRHQRRLAKQIAAEDDRFTHQCRGSGSRAYIQRVDEPSGTPREEVEIDPLDDDQAGAMGILYDLLPDVGDKVNLSERITDPKQRQLLRQAARIASANFKLIRAGETCQRIA